MRIAVGGARVASFVDTGDKAFVSDDGSRVYFVTAKPLEGVAAPANGTTTSPGLSGTVGTSGAGL